MSIKSSEHYQRNTRYNNEITVFLSNDILSTEVCVYIREYKDL